MAINGFALRIAFANVIGYVTAVWFPLWASPFVKHFPLLPDQEFNFSLGNYILILIPIVGYLSYSTIKSDPSQNQKWFNQRWFRIPLYLIAFSYIDLPFSSPFPNAWIVLVPICFSLIITISVIIHDHNINFDFIYESDKIISESIKLTRIRLEYDIWFKLFLTIITGYSVIALSYFIKLPEMTVLMTKQDMSIGIFLYYLH